MSAGRPSLRSVRAQPESRPRRGRADETRRRLVAAAGVVFARDGYEDTDTNRIAREAGYSPGTFYKHFRNKKEVFVAVYDEWVAGEWREIEAITATGSDRKTRARAIVAAVVDYHRRWRVLRRSLRALVARDADVRRVYTNARARQLDTMAQLGSNRSREADAILLYTLERTADALADGEPAQLGLTESAVVDQLVDRLVDRGV